MYSCYKMMLLAHLMHMASGSYTVTITLHSYSNPLHTCSVCSVLQSLITGLDGCCDEYRVISQLQQCTGSYRCDTAFSFCLLPEGSSARPPISCAGPSIETDTDIDSDGTISFPVGEVLGISNPFFLGGISDKWTGVQFQTTVWDRDTQSSDDGIDVFQFDINNAPETPPQMAYIDGYHGIAKLNFSYQVTCDQRFYGDSCQHFDDCPSPETCGSNGTCIDGQGAYFCQCDPGFTGEICNVEIQEHDSNISDCVGVTCSDQGRCVDGDNSFTCQCYAGFTGVDCETDIDDCASVNCSEQGHCIDGNSSHICSCIPGFTGENCAINIDECTVTSCTGNGLCIDGVNSVTCECDSGYTGERCNSIITPDLELCSNHSCVNGSCVSIANASSEPACICDPGYTGERYRCNSIPGLDPCSNYSCVNGLCVANGSSGPVCTCDPGYTGERCSIDINDCVGVDCGINHRCVDMVNSYSCVCDVGYTGNACEVSTEGATGNTDAAVETKVRGSLPLVVGGVIGGVTILLLLLIIVLIILGVIIFQARARKRASPADRIRDSKLSSNDLVMPDIGQYDRQPESFKITANVGYGALGLSTFSSPKDNPASDDDYYNGDLTEFRHQAYHSRGDPHESKNMTVL